MVDKGVTMGFYGGYPGMNGPLSYNYYNDFVNSGFGPVQTGLPSVAPGQGTAHGKPEQKKTGFGAFFSGIKNGFTGMVKNFFTVPGFLLTAASIAGVALFGAGMLFPLIAVGVGVGGYQFIKGAVNGDAEKMGEGVFTLGTTLLGAKLTPNKIDVHELADTSLWAKFKLPFVGKGVFKDPEVTFWRAICDEGVTGLERLKELFKGKSSSTGANKPVPLTQKNLAAHTEKSASEHGQHSSASSESSWKTVSNDERVRLAKTNSDSTSFYSCETITPEVATTEPKKGASTMKTARSVGSESERPAPSSAEKASAPAAKPTAKPTRMQRLFGRKNPSRKAKPVAPKSKSSNLKTESPSKPGLLRTLFREHPDLKAMQYWLWGKSNSAEPGAAGTGSDWHQLSTSDKFQRFATNAKEANVASATIFGVPPNFGNKDNAE